MHIKLEKFSRLYDSNSHENQCRWKVTSTQHCEWIFCRYYWLAVCGWKAGKNINWRKSKGSEKHSVQRLLEEVRKPEASSSISKIRNEEDPRKWACIRLLRRWLQRTRGIQVPPRERNRERKQDEEGRGWEEEADKERRERYQREGGIRAGAANQSIAFAGPETFRQRSWTGGRKLRQLGGQPVR